MSKSTVIGIIVVLVVLAGGGILLASHKSPTKTNTSTTDMSNMNSNSSSSSSNNSSNNTPSATNKVTIANFAFSPASITVKKGTTVTWTNNDSAAHTVTETDGQKGPKSGNVDPGKSFVFTFDTPGTYKYNCSIHPSMTGTVTVTE